jgi:photosystem II stability/assembly factor-like uncharacterized protein
MITDSPGRALTRLVKILLVSMLWQLAASAQDRSCWLRDGASPAPSLVYLLCEQGGLLVTTDGGASWSNRATGTTGHLRNIDFIDANHGFAAGDQGLLVATADGGKTWTPRKTGVTENLTAVQFVGQLGWVTGYDGVILHSADGGRTWSPQTTDTKESLENIFFLDPQHGWAVGWAGLILRTTDGGTTWRQMRTDAATWSLSAVYFRDASNGWIVGFGGQIVRSRDGGATWAAQTSPVKSSLTSILFDSSNRGWITADDGLLVSENGGESWMPVSVDGLLFLRQLVRVDNSLWAVGQLGVLRQTGAGLAWRRIESLVPDDPTRDTYTSSVSASSPPN